MAKVKGNISAAAARKTNEITVKNSRTGEVQGSIFTKNTQFGTPTVDTKLNPTLKTYGDLRAYGGISGSLQNLTDGISYLAAGSGITIVTGSSGQITITAGSISPADVLTMGNGFDPYGTTYNGAASTSVAILAESGKGLGVTSAGVKLDPGTLSSTTSATTSWEVIVANGSVPYRSTINNILALGINSNITLTYPVTFNSAGGIRDVGGAAQYNNTATVDLAVKLESNKGLAVTSAGIKIDPSVITSATVAATDKVLIGDVDDNDNVKYVTAQSIADLASAGILQNPITIGNGLSPYSTQFDGSSAVSISVALNGSTIMANSSGIAVANVPNALTNGSGIASLNYDGSAALSVDVKAVSTGGLKSSASGIELDILNLPTGFPALADQLIFYDDASGIAARTQITEFKNDIIDPATAASRATLLASNNAWSGQNTFGVSSTAGLTGSLQEVSPGIPYLVGGSNVTVSYDNPANGQITISSIGGGGSIPVSSPMVTWEADAALTDERVITGSSGFSIVNNGVDKLTLTTNPQKVSYILTAPLSANTQLVVPGVEFSDNQYAYNKTDVFLNGALLLSGSGNDYYLGGQPSDIFFTFNLEEEDSLLIKLN